MKNTGSLQSTAQAEGRKLQAQRGPGDSEQVSCAKIPSVVMNGEISSKCNIPHRHSISEREHELRFSLANNFTLFISSQKRSSHRRLCDGKQH